jgi:hypothetical protein
MRADAGHSNAATRWRDQVLAVLNVISVLLLIGPLVLMDAGALGRPCQCYARCAPGFPSSTANDLSVLIRDCGSLTSSSVRRLTRQCPAESSATV